LVGCSRNWLRKDPSFGAAADVIHLTIYAYADHLEKIVSACGSAKNSGSGLGGARTGD
jgi:hypothetical protein